MNSPLKIRFAQAIAPNIIKVDFSNGISKNFDIIPLTNRPHYDALLNFNFLKNLSVDPSGYCIFWNDYVDICESELWEKGIEST